MQALILGTPYLTQWYASSGTIQQLKNDSSFGKMVSQKSFQKETLTKRCGTTCPHNHKVSPFSFNNKHYLLYLKIIFVLHIQLHTILIFLANSFSNQGILQAFMLLHLNVFQFNKTSEFSVEGSCTNPSGLALRKPWCLEI